MIPYDDLVAALSAWRARQGLPVSTVGGSASGPTPVPGSGPHHQAQGKPGSGPNRGAPPPAPPPSASRPGMPVAAVEAEPLEVADEILDDEAYEGEGEGGDFAVGFGGAPAPEPTATGGAPERPTETDLGNDREDW